MVEGYGSQTYYEMIKKKADDTVEQKKGELDGRLKANGGCTGCQWKDNHEEQLTNCKLYEKASHDNRCMYLHFGEYCDYQERNVKDDNF